ncbi:hypothetical protein [Sagittula sp. MA-2]|jgi:hypothetical protein|uniref:hypothetical protein n=1 Tax=Sagittula sp. MA-2 TaxID=3048007 RepID=UPI0024C24C7C|nr:hypothetical protein [Sagittula sp. MA-2]WHZ35762.1 hypothetical protein QNI11_01865 [Sagittula sp. MA-2]
MSFFPSDFDPRAEIRGILDLCEIDTADGTVRFLIGEDGKLIDANGDEWVGSALGSVSSMESAIDGVAPSGTLSLSFFQDPDTGDVIQQIKDLGLDYVAGREIRFYILPLRSVADMTNQSRTPIKWCTRVSRQVSYKFSGAQDRRIALSFEAWSERRQAARRIVLNTEGHKQLTGSANPSLKYMPTVDFETEKLFG